MGLIPAKIRKLVEQQIARAEETELGEPRAVTLSTVDADGRPSSRVVLLRGFDERGFVFYTNTLSRKGAHIGGNPAVALCFHWDPLRQQMRVEGVAEPVSEAEADTYWRSRPRESQVGAWASRQSERLESRGALEEQFAACEARFAGQEIPRPPHWSGYRVVPRRIELWTSRPARLHDRLVFEQQQDGSWDERLLYP